MKQNSPLTMGSKDVVGDGGLKVLQMSVLLRGLNVCHNSKAKA